MKIVTVLGTRPEIIRLSRVIKKLDKCIDHVLVHTGQNFDRSLSDLFFDELGVRQPDHHLQVKEATAGHQIAEILRHTEEIFLQEKPDRLLVLGDTNSALCALIAKRMGIGVLHAEAGNRCYDDRVPEEVNRRLIDHSSDILMPYTERSRANLLREGVDGRRIFVTGNPIMEVIENYRAHVEASEVLEKMSLSPNGFFLATLHRAENVDIAPRLHAFTTALGQLGATHGIPVIVSTHPRTSSKMREFGISEVNGNIRFCEPFGLFDFIKLEQNARCVLTDSGTVQEECAIFQLPNVTLRDVTERPETLECGSNILSGANPIDICRAVELAIGEQAKWSPPAEYLVQNVADVIVRLATGFHLGLTVSRH